MRIEGGVCLKQTSWGLCRKELVAGEEESLNNWCLGFIASKLSEYIGGGDAEGEQRAGTHTEGITVCLFLAFLFTCIPVSSEVCVCRKIEGAGKIMERDQF